MAVRIGGPYPSLEMPSRQDFATFNAREFYAALEAGRLYPQAWVHLATWWLLTGRCPEWPDRPDNR